MNKKTLFLLGGLTLFGFSGLGFLINWCFRDLQPLAIFEHGMPAIWQLLIGLPFGVLIALSGWWYMSSPWMNEEQHYYRNIARSLNLGTVEVLLLSLCAGVGEEILFRGAFQFYGGIWITSLVFVAIHGYLDPRNWRISLYGLIMVLFIAAIGWAAKEWGMITAMAAHFSFDVVMFLKLLQLGKTASPQNPLEAEKEEHISDGF